MSPVSFVFARLSTALNLRAIDGFDREAAQKFAPWQYAHASIPDRSTRSPCLFTHDCPMLCRLWGPPKERGRVVGWAADSPTVIHVFNACFDL